jgi:hypothetical protein
MGVLSICPQTYWYGLSRHSTKCISLSWAEGSTPNLAICWRLSRFCWPYHKQQPPLTVDPPFSFLPFLSYLTPVRDSVP